MPGHQKILPTLGVIAETGIVRGTSSDVIICHDLLSYCRPHSRCSNGVFRPLCVLTAQTHPHACTPSPHHHHTVSASVVNDGTMLFLVLTCHVRAIMAVSFAGQRPDSAVFASSVMGGALLGFGGMLYVLVSQCASGNSHRTENLLSKPSKTLLGCLVSHLQWIQGVAEATPEQPPSDPSMQ